MSWTTVVDDNFGRANAPASGAGTSSGAGNGWIDSAGGTWSVQSNTLVGSTSDGGGYLSKTLLRPSGEAAVGQRVVARATYPFGMMSAVLRAQAGPTYYLMQLDGVRNAYQVYMYAIVNGSVSQVMAVNLTTPLVSGHAYSMDAYASGSGPTSLSIVVSDVTAGTTIGTCTASDSTGVLQQAGVPGLVEWVGTGGATPTVTAFSEVTTYSGSASTAGLTLLPVAASLTGGGATQTLTATRTGGTGALAASVSGGGTLSTTAPSSGVAFSYTSPGSGSGTASITVTDAVDGVVATATVSYSASAASITLSPSIVTAGAAAQVVTVTGSGTAFAGTPFSISGGEGAALVSQSVASGTSGTITLATGVAGGGNIIVSASGATAALSVMAPNLGPLKIGFIGDSITAGTNGDPVSAAAAYLTAQGYSVTAVNRGSSGSSTADWQPGGSFLTGAISAFLSAGVTIVQVMLGTNDFRTPNNLTVLQHVANMRAIIRALRAAGLQVILHKPIWSLPNAAFNGVQWPNDPQSLYRGAWQALMGQVDGVSVFAGDTAGHVYSALNATTFLATDGIHPGSATTNTMLGQFWALAFLNRYGPLFPRYSYS